MTTSTFLLLISCSCLSEKLNQVAPINSVHIGGRHGTVYGGVEVYQGVEVYGGVEVCG